MVHSNWTDIFPFFEDFAEAVGSTQTLNNLRQKKGPKARDGYKCTCSSIAKLPPQLLWQLCFLTL